ncbi:Na(+)/H(+) exchange regulatory cofactor NHE-RF3-like [Octopus sinensis]|uniref:Na(+)/H(+) exchange regulatory cofactor NHE-RF3-like n=1 Tax=Octopus sinensis TaxID=2607531 RepID=A0A6P7U2D5_9MOLL|nr:Na(+)/H(+) exchange regulatory cofactor NHE-RF3-like [Octopus sinensis]
MAYQGNFDEAAKLYEQAGQKQMALQIYLDVGMFQKARVNPSLECSPTELFNRARYVYNAIERMPKSIKISKILTLKHPENIYGFSVDSNPNTKTHIISDVRPNSAGEKSGLRVDDVIVKINGENVTKKSINRIREIIMKCRKNLIFEVDRDEIVGSHKEVKSLKKSPTKFSSKAKTLEELRIKSVPSEKKFLKTPTVRLCRIVLENEEEYGFTLSTIKSGQLHSICNVTENSQADKAKIKENDILIEINHTPILEMNHIMAVNEILKNPREISLLVTDPESYEYFTNKGISISTSTVNVEYYTNSLNSLLF